MQAAVSFIQNDVGGFDGDFASLGHGVTSIDHQVHQDLSQLAEIGLYLTQRRTENSHQINVLAPQPHEHLLTVGDYGVEVQHLMLKYLSPAEGQQLSGQ